VPEELKETFIQVSAQQKPLVAIYLIKNLGYKRMLCFVKSKETANRLNRLFEVNGIKSSEYSAALHANRRKKIQTKFEKDQLDILVCSDVMARGMVNFLIECKLFN
jgi:ATP-dependent RNA helicase DDX51/DBP6